MFRSTWIQWLRRLSRNSPRKQQRTPRGERFRPRLEALEDRTLLSSYVVNLGTDTGGPSGSGSGLTGDLRYCINQADADPGSTITFDSSLAGTTITLAQGELAISANMAITGLGASSLTISGGNLNRVFDITASTAQVAISDLTISGGSATEGGGILNRGSLTVSNSILSGNTASDIGGGVYNGGSLKVSGSTLSGNSATKDSGGGGGIFNDLDGSLRVSDSTLSGNSASTGGGIFNHNYGSLTVSDSTLSGNSAYLGGGIYNNGYGSLRVSSSTLSGNSATWWGGGIYNAGSLLTISGSTLSGNSAAEGGGIYNASSSAVTLSNVTIADNRASSNGGGFSIASGTPVLHNTLIAGNLVGSTRSDVSGALDATSDYNLIGDGSGMTGISDGDANHNQVGSAANPIDPLLAPLGDYGGSTQTMALLPGSPAIDQGNSAYGGSTDQRGKDRVGATDIGAFESQGFTITVSSGDGQSADFDTAFAQPLVVSVSANDPVEPVQGGRVTFTAKVPVSGASAVFSGNPTVIDSDGKASVTATANATAGSYQVLASVSGSTTPASFTLTNLTPNQPPVITNPGTQASNEGDAVSLSIQASDPNGLPLTYSAVGLPAGLSIDSNTGIISGTLGNQAASTTAYTVTVSASDGSNTGTTIFNWTVNDATTPVITSNLGNQTSNEDSTITPLTVSATDADGDPLTYTATGLPPGLSINSSTGIFSGTIGKQAASATPYTVVVSATDGVNTASRTFTWTVRDVTTPALGKLSNQSNVEGAVVNLPVSATDADGDPLTYSAVGLPPGLSINSSTGIISGTIDNQAASKTAYKVTVSVSDGLNSASKTFSWSVSDGATPVITNPGDQTSTAGQAVSLPISATDAGGDPLTYTAKGLPAGLSINSSTGLISGTIAVGASKKQLYKVTVTVSDGFNTGSTTFNWTVTG